MKKAISILLVLSTLLCFVSCAKKSRPSIEIKNESVSSIELRRTVFSAENPSERSYFQKTVDKKEDVETLISWIEQLSLEKHDPIEIPIEKVQYVLILKGIKDHRLIFMDEYVVYDSTAFTYKSEKQMTEISEKYNLSNYPETSVSSLGII